MPVEKRRARNRISFAVDEGSRLKYFVDDVAGRAIKWRRRHRREQRDHDQQQWINASSVAGTRLATQAEPICGRLATPRRGLRLRFRPRHRRRRDQV